jgi:hypothetical protein
VTVVVYKGFFFLAVNDFPPAVSPDGISDSEMDCFGFRFHCHRHPSSFRNYTTIDEKLQGRDFNTAL